MSINDSSADALVLALGFFGNPFDSVLALVVFAMAVAILGAAAWIAFRAGRL